MRWSMLREWTLILITMCSTQLTIGTCMHVHVLCVCFALKITTFSSMNNTSQLNFEFSTTNQNRCKIPALRIMKYMHNDLVQVQLTVYMLVLIIVSVFPVTRGEADILSSLAMYIYVCIVLTCNELLDTVSNLQHYFQFIHAC